MGYVRPFTKSVTIASGGTTSEALPTSVGTILGFRTPATLTSTAVTFTGCATATGTFVPVYDSEGNQVSVTVTTSRGYTLSGSDADAILGHPFIKMVFGSAEGGDRSISVTIR